MRLVKIACFEIFTTIVAMNYLIKVNHISCPFTCGLAVPLGDEVRDDFRRAISRILVSIMLYPALHFPHTLYFRSDRKCRSCSLVSGIWNPPSNLQPLPFSNTTLQCDEQVGLSHNRRPTGRWRQSALGVSFLFIKGFRLLPELGVLPH